MKSIEVMKWQLAALAINKKNTSIVTYLLDIGVNVNHSAADTPLEHSISDSDIEIARLLLARGCRPESRSTVDLGTEPPR